MSDSGRMPDDPASENYSAAATASDPAVAELEVDALNAEGKNLRTILCKFCASKVLTPGVATLRRSDPRFLPSMHQKKPTTPTPAVDENGRLAGESLRDFWLVTDMFQFENVGFSNSVGGVKYLICADCEMGPIGFHDTKTPKEFHVALERVDHK